RTTGNYRRYGEPHRERLARIRAYRNAGLTLDDIRGLLDAKGGSDATAVLERRLTGITAEIERLRGHQRSILQLLRTRQSFRRFKMLTKDKLVSIMRAAGLTDDDMNRFHTEFERTAPAEHQEFLEFLKIPAEEIGQIREWSRKGK
ncbi:MAG TPA: MerR family DNA-binding protein, partial [Bryobacteraceae bacterium]|nr:MerR family DNA-binding protein [Bryobacteraceae bacterium]